MMTATQPRTTKQGIMPSHDGGSGARQLVSGRIFGSLLRGLRQDRGRGRGQAFCDEMYRRTGVLISERTLYAMEKGQQEATFAQVVAFVFTLRPDGGIHYFGGALPAELAMQFHRMNCPPRP